MWNVDSWNVPFGGTILEGKIRELIDHKFRLHLDEIGQRWDCISRSSSNIYFRNFNFEVSIILSQRWQNFLLINQASPRRKMSQSSSDGFSSFSR